jgi:hypothetical protein
MSKIIKISDSTTLKLTELMYALQEIGCCSGEKLKACKIFKIYLDGKGEINEETTMIRRQNKKGDINGKR